METMKTKHQKKNIEMSKNSNLLLRFACHISFKAGVCRPCDTIELTATWKFSSSRRVEKVCADLQLFWGVVFSLFLLKKFGLRNNVKVSD